MIGHNILHECRAAKNMRVLELWSSCLYPQDRAEAMYEDPILTCASAPTNEYHLVA